MAVPVPTPVLRFIHLDSLHIYLRRGALHAPNFTPDDGLVYRTNHNEDVQAKRHHTRISCGPGGTVHDYIPFYFGPLSPMMLNLKTGRVPGYDEGQEPFIFAEKLEPEHSKLRELRSGLMFARLSDRVRVRENIKAKEATI